MALSNEEFFDLYQTKVNPNEILVRLEKTAPLVNSFYRPIVETALKKDLSTALSLELASIVINQVNFNSASDSAIAVLNQHLENVEGFYLKV